MCRVITLALVALLGAVWVAAAVSWTHALPGPATVELAQLGTGDPQAPVREDEIQVARHEGGKPHDDEIQAPWQVPLVAEAA